MRRRVTMNDKGLKYRGCHTDCEGCVYQVKAVYGRQHGCYCEDYVNRCPSNPYWEPSQTVIIEE